MIERQTAPTLRLQRLWQGTGAEVLVTRWSAAEHPTVRHGNTDYAVIEMMLAGGFEKQSQQGYACADTNTAMLFRPGEAFRISHTTCSANAGLTIRIASDCMGQWLPSSLWQSTTRLVSPAIVLEAHRLIQLLSDDRKRPMTSTVDRRIASVISMLLRADQTPEPKQSSFKRIERARAYLNMNLASPVRRGDVARAAGCSPWLLSREFTLHVGLSMQSYLMKLRLRTALRALAEGCEDLTNLALGLGFSSHSHFSAAFKKEFGCSPRSVWQ